MSSCYLFTLSFMPCAALWSSGSSSDGPSLKPTLLILPREAERHLVVVVVHRRAGVDPTSKVSSIVKRAGMVWGMLLGRDFLAVHLQYAGAALAMPGPSYLKSNTMVCLPGVERLLAFPAESLKGQEIVGEHRLALEQIEAVAAEAATVGDDHPLAAALRDLDLGGDGVGLAEDVRCVAVGQCRTFRPSR